MEEIALQIFPWLSILIVLPLLFHIMAKHRSSPRLPPGPKPLPFIGNILELGQNPHRSFALLARSYGPIMCLRLGRIRTIVISSPALAKEVLQTKEHCLSGRRVPDILKNIRHHEVSLVWMSVSPLWRLFRNLLKTHLSNTQSLEATQSLRRRKLWELVQHIRGEQGKAIRIARPIFCTIFNLISTIIFSMDIVDFKSDSSQEFKDIVGDMLTESGKPNLSDFFPFLAPFDLQGRRRAVNVQYSKLFDLFELMIEKRLGKASPDEEKRADPDMLDALLQLNREDSSKLSRRAIKGFLVDVLLAGTDTSTSTVEWALAELIRHPEHMAKVREEIISVVGSEREVDESDLSRLPFLQAVTKETLRLHPPGPLLIPHRAEESTEVGGYQVPKNSQVIVNVWGIGRDERIWENPDCFMPDRFLGEKTSIDFKGQCFEFIPFGSGRRMCPGLMLGVRMVQLLLATLIHSFEWKLQEGMETKGIDMTEKFGLSLVMASPLEALAIPLLITEKPVSSIETVSNGFDLM